jgi:hypothetical protein
MPGNRLEGSQKDLSETGIRDGNQTHVEKTLKVDPKKIGKADPQPVYPHL